MGKDLLTNPPNPHDNQGMMWQHAIPNERQARELQNYKHQNTHVFLVHISVYSPYLTSWKHMVYRIIIHKQDTNHTATDLDRPELWIIILVQELAWLIRATQCVCACVCVCTSCPHNLYEENKLAFSSALLLLCYCAQQNADMNGNRCVGKLICTVWDREQTNIKPLDLTIYYWK